MRAAQAAQLIPPMPSSSTWGATSKPALRIAASTASPSAASGPALRRALPVAKLTWAETPGRRLSTFSRRTAQAAQLMPVTGRS